LPFTHNEVVEDVGGPVAVINAIRTIARTGALPDDLRARLREVAASRDGFPRAWRGNNQHYAECLLAVGEADAAFDALAVAVECGFADIAWADHCPLLDAWRGDARWTALRARIAERGRDVGDAWRVIPEAEALITASRSPRARPHE